MPHDLANHLQSFLNMCDRLGIAPQSARQPALLAAVKTQSHESVLFFLCGRDYIYNPTDLKLRGIEELFIGRGTPFEINVGDSVADDMKRTLRAPAVKVSFETGAPHVIAAYQRRHEPGVRAGGVANYNLGTKALAQSIAGFGPKFLKDTVAAVNDGRSSGFVPGVSDHRVFVVLQDMRNRTRPYWMYDMPQIGL